MQQLLSLIVIGTFAQALWAADHQKQGTEKSQKERPEVQAEYSEDLLLARLGDTSSSSGYRQLFIYSPDKLTGVQLKIGEAENWSEMSSFSSDTHQAYGTKSYLPSAPGQKYTLRAIRPDGSRFTSLLTVDPKDGSVIGIKKIKEESKEEVEAQKKKEPAADTTSSVLMRAQANIGRCLGGGDCSALRGSGPAVGRIGGGGAGFEQLMPGQVLRLSPGAGLSGSMGYFRVGPTGHYIVVESVNPDGTITFLDQNWAGGSSSGRFVRRATGNLRSLSGSATIYSGN